MSASQRLQFVAADSNQGHAVPLDRQARSMKLLTSLRNRSKPGECQYALKSCKYRSRTASTPWIWFPPGHPLPHRLDSTQPGSSNTNRIFMLKHTPTYTPMTNSYWFCHLVEQASRIPSYESHATRPATDAGLRTASWQC